MASERGGGDDQRAVTVVSQSAKTYDGGNVTMDAGGAKAMATMTPPVSSSNLQKLSVSEPLPRTVALLSSASNSLENQPVVTAQSPASDLTRSTPGVSPTVVTTQVVIQNGPLPPGVQQPKLDGGTLASMSSEPELESVGGTRIVKIAANEAASQPVKKTKGRFKVLDAPILQTQQQNGSVVPSSSVASPLPPKKPQPLVERSASSISVPGKPAQSNLSERSLSSGQMSSGGSPQGHQNGAPVPQPPPIVKKKGRFVVMSAEAGDAKALARQASQLQSAASVEPAVSAAPVAQHQVACPSVPTEQIPTQKQPSQQMHGSGSSQSLVQHGVVQSASIVPPASAQDGSVDVKSPTHQTLAASAARSSIAANGVQPRPVAAVSGSQVTSTNSTNSTNSTSVEAQQQPPVVKSATASPVTVSVEPKLPTTVSKPKANPAPPRPTTSSAKPPSAFDSKGVGSPLGLGKVFYFLDQMKQEVTEADRTIKTMHAEAKHLKERNKQLEAKVRDMEKKWNEEKAQREAADARVKTLRKKLRDLKAAAGDGASGVIPPSEPPLSTPRVGSLAEQGRSHSRSSSIGYTDESAAAAVIELASTTTGKMTLDSVTASKTITKSTLENGTPRTNNEIDTPLRKPPSSDGYQSAGEARKLSVDKESPRNQSRESDSDTAMNGAGPSMVNSFDPLKNTNRLATSLDSIDSTNSSMNNTMNLRPRPQNGIPVVMAPSPPMMVNGGDMGGGGANGVGMNMGAFNMNSMQQQQQTNMMMNQGGMMPHQMGIALQQQMMQQAAVAMGQMQPMANNGQQAGPQQTTASWAPYAMAPAGSQFPNAQAFVQQTMQLNGGNGHAMNGNAMNGNGHTMNGNGHMKGGSHQQQPQNAGSDPFDMLAWRGPGVPTQPQQTPWTAGQGLT